MSTFKNFIGSIVLIAAIGVLVFSSVSRTQAATLSAEEEAAILYMREEEKLARDVYITLYKMWGLQTFQKISQSEQNHMEAVKTLIDRYGLPDPASRKIGVFTNPYLQALYNDLIVRGERSLAEALKVGGAIEEIDILDLRTYLSQTDKSDIQQVYNHILNGSYNHLNAFVSTLSARFSETYQPQYLDAEAYQAIIGAGNQKGCNRCQR